MSKREREASLNLWVGDMKDKQLKLKIAARLNREGPSHELIEHIIQLYAVELEKANAEIARLRRGEKSWLEREGKRLEKAKQKGNKHG